MQDKPRRAIAALTNGLLSGPLDDEAAHSLFQTLRSPPDLPGLVLLARDRADDGDRIDALLRTADPDARFGLDRVQVRFDRQDRIADAESMHLPRPLLTAHAVDRLHERHAVRFGDRGVGQLVAFANLCLWALSNRMLTTRWEEHPYGASIEFPVPGGAFVGTVEDEAVVFTTWISEAMLRPDQAWLRSEGGSDVIAGLRSETRRLQATAFGWPERRRPVEFWEPSERGLAPSLFA